MTAADWPAFAGPAAGGSSAGPVSAGEPGGGWATGRRLSRVTDSARSSRATASGLLMTASAAAALRSENAVGTATASTASTPSSAATSCTQARKACVVTTGLVSTGPVTTAAAGSSRRSARWVAAASSTTCRPWSAQASAASAAAPPALAMIATRLPGRQRLACEQRGGIDQLPEALGGDDARQVEHGLLVGQRRRGRRGVRGGPVACRGPGADDGQHRHPLRDPAGRAGELARVAERFHVQDRELGYLILRPPGQQVGGGHVVLVAGRHER